MEETMEPGPDNSVHIHELNIHPCVRCKEHCCIGCYGTFITLGDLKRIAKATGKKPQEFATYADISSDPEEQEEVIKERTHSYFEYSKDGKILQLKSKPNGECIFLKDLKCSIYNSRPLICKIFPIGFRKTKEGVKLLIEEEDEHCPATAGKSIPDILKFLGFSEKEAMQLITQFLEEIEEYKLKISSVSNENLNQYA